MKAEDKPAALASTEGLGAGSEARPYLASDMRPRDGGPRFRVTRSGECVEDEDFIFDAMLRIGGDFGDGRRTAYAQWIADALNKADEKLPREPRGA